jgi:hypothetical protein
MWRIELPSIRDYVLYAEGTSGAEAMSGSAPQDQTQPTVLASGEAPLGKPTSLSAQEIARLLQPDTCLSPSQAALIVNFLSGGDGRPPGEVGAFSMPSALTRWS